ncbi:MAG TPA: bifunctional 5,10-methylenetetrahydrofolate dehydrogenase/5,10-methenyltetrahydrofolate cyclohydrolase [Candidatus Saccharimonadales bacterium]|nr:bifunctional 5,10-methylenetetrahydrofolate dehydrogenase/5,10-methenyltetrahydrofolate cyclohydrolase [Candidatus Saccharimonadales bacterium]
MKVLNGLELAGFIKERQAHEVRGLRQAHGIRPKLAIVATIDHPAIEVYMRMKARYGDDILVEVETHRVVQSEASALIQKLNTDDSVHGIIVQLPLEDPSGTEEIVNLVAPEKDVDALGAHATLDPATPLAILWLLAGYNVDLAGKKIVLVGRGKLVGAPLERMLLASGNDVTVVDRKTPDAATIIREADVIVTATGTPGLVKSDMIKEGAVVVDAGVAGEQGKTVGDLADDVYERQDLTITPRKGGVGPLTICALFENVIRAARATTASPVRHAGA